MIKHISSYKKILPCAMVILLLTFFSGSFSNAQEDNKPDFSNAKGHWTLLGGYGNTHTNFGDTQDRVQELDLILQYGHFLTKEAGKSWYKVRHEIMLELPFSAVFHPHGAIMAGINLLACWDFTASEKIVPYVFAGGGLVYTNLGLEGMGRELNGNYQTGTGIHYIIDKRTVLNFNYRLHHISNANTADPNEPLNSSKFLVGVSFLR
ncbi:MAG: acyloxyacyl hydrolase [Nitrospiraceae bacterium]|nr:MAG: acyloxyacyl hydrolase [Nitrospiraceae bacterium]